MKEIEISFKGESMTRTESELERMKIISKRDVVRYANVSYSTVYRMEKSGEFPRRIQISRKRVGWYTGEVKDWLEARKVA